MPGIIVYAEQNQKNSKYKAESSIYNTNENPRLKICFHKNFILPFLLISRSFEPIKAGLGLLVTFGRIVWTRLGHQSQGYDHNLKKHKKNYIRLRVNLQSVVAVIVSNNLDWQSTNSRFNFKDHTQSSSSSFKHKAQVQSLRSKLKAWPSAQSLEIEP